MRQVQDRGYVNESRIHFPSSAAGLNFTTFLAGISIFFGAWIEAYARFLLYNLESPETDELYLVIIGESLLD